MSWITTLFACRIFGPVAPADASGATAINNAPNDARKAIRSNMEDAVGRPEAQIAEEIRHRQIVLITRYVTMVRAR